MLRLPDQTIQPNWSVLSWKMSAERTSPGRRPRRPGNERRHWRMPLDTMPRRRITCAKWIGLCVLIHDVVRPKRHLLASSTSPLAAWSGLRRFAMTVAQLDRARDFTGQTVGHHRGHGSARRRDGVRAGLAAAPTSRCSTGTSRTPRRSWSGWARTRAGPPSSRPTCSTAPACATARSTRPRAALRQGRRAHQRRRRAITRRRPPARAFVLRPAARRRSVRSST